VFLVVHPAAKAAGFFVGEGICRHPWVARSCLTFPVNHHLTAMEHPYTLHQAANGQYFVPVPEPLVARFAQKGMKRVLCRVNKEYELHCAFIRSRDTGPYIYISKELVKKLGLKKGEELQLVFAEDTTEHQFPMPEELAEVLRTDPEAEARFRELTDGARRTLLVYVSQVKSADKRVERSLKVAERLRLGLRSAREIVR